ncbi:hypothetical protein M427DRAFT_33153 [Gonapodya prolifera JEL478]|uniref:Uncharacterized protein n=1 Tax=Gonapodya prolifera (strain JEL478) TaxID=1344416 RepID=A0A139ACH4_GONPJ|nr:hypothetical protein M427DRAFT_33153 [Gonapodya prolifera JEL478]|eukprot:KXS14470.1 hypothetical protein M427DRAFT_33153 [Gonapodya prolifera JEL478]
MGKKQASTKQSRVEANAPAQPAALAKVSTPAPAAAPAPTARSEKPKSAAVAPIKRETTGKQLKATKNNALILNRDFGYGPFAVRMQHKFGSERPRPSSTRSRGKPSPTALTTSPLPSQLRPEWQKSQLKSPISLMKASTGTGAVLTPAAAATALRKASASAVPQSPTSAAFWSSGHPEEAKLRQQIREHEEALAKRDVEVANLMRALVGMRMPRHQQRNQNKVKLQSPMTLPESHCLLDFSRETTAYRSYAERADAGGGKKIKDG